MPAWPTHAQPSAGSSIYSCVDAQGKRHTSDRPITECQAQDQNLLNPDGSIRKTLPRPLTREEQEAADARARELEIENAKRREAVLRDRNLLARFPNEAAHAKARAAALDTVQKSIGQSEKRLTTLAAERKPLSNEAEFYVGRQMPLTLKQSLDANDAATGAQRELIVNQQAELTRINTLFDIELERLKRLWSGAAPGSMGTIPPARPVAADTRKPSAR